MPEKLLTAAEVAKYLSIPEKEVDRLVADGRLTGYKIGGTFLRFKPEQVEALRRIYPWDKGRVTDRLADFFYFNDFYILSAVLVLFLLAIILLVD